MMGTGLDELGFWRKRIRSLARSSPAQTKAALPLEVEGERPAAGLQRPVIGSLVKRSSGANRGDQEPAERALLGEISRLRATPRLRKKSQKQDLPKPRSSDLELGPSAEVSQHVIFHNADKSVSASSHISTYPDLKHLLRLDLIHFVLLAREQFWDLFLNRRLYFPDRLMAMGVLLAALLFLFGSFWGGLAILGACYFMREKWNG